MPAKKSRPNLSTEQWEIVGQFNDYAADYPRLTFDQVAKKVLGKTPYPSTPTGRKFRTECKAMFDRERAK
jgi:hypothetical protein